MELVGLAFSSLQYFKFKHACYWTKNQLISGHLIFLIYDTFCVINQYVISVYSLRVVHLVLQIYYLVINATKIIYEGYKDSKIT